MNKFDRFMSENTQLDSKPSKAEFEQIKKSFEKKQPTSFFFPLLITSCAALVLTLSFFLRSPSQNIPQQSLLQQNSAEAFLFETYFTVEKDLEIEEADEDSLYYPI